MTPKKTVFVTGANGFIGRRVCADLLHSGWAVRGLMRKIDSRLTAGVDPIVGDLENDDALKSGLLGASAVVHLAGRAHVMKETAADPLAEYRRVNVDGTRRLLEQAVRARVERFVFISTVKAVGEVTTRPWTEKTPARPVDPYGVSKFEAEVLVHERAVKSGMGAITLRLPLVYGPGVGANMLRLFELIDRGVPFPLGSVQNRRSLAFVGNVAAAIVKVLDAPDAAAEIFFVCDSECLSTPTLIREIGKALGRPIMLIPVAPGLIRILAGANDKLGALLPLPSASGTVNRLLDSLEVDAEKVTRLTGFIPPFSVTEGLAETAAWFRSQKGHRK